MNAVEVAAALPAGRIVTALGTATSAVRDATGDGPHLYMGGAMGAALAVALGVAEELPGEPVVALVGDGELLMRTSSLWAVAAARPANLAIVVLCNGRYAITGGQPLPHDGDFAAVATALGLAAARAETAEAVAGLLATLARPCLVEAVIDDPTRPVASPFVDCRDVASRFRAGVVTPRRPSG
jgi:thiamine pyrophosphate-dependent acetolactate synthase large subunit-like protein